MIKPSVVCQLQCLLCGEFLYSDVIGRVDGKLLIMHWHSKRPTYSPFPDEGKKYVVRDNMEVVEYFDHDC